MHKLVKAVLRELCHSMIRKRILPNIEMLSIFTSVFVLIFPCDYESWAATEKVLSQVQRYEFSEEPMKVTLRNKLRKYEIRKALNVESVA